MADETELDTGEHVTAHLIEDADTPQEGAQYEAIVIRRAKGPSGFVEIEFTNPPEHLMSGLGTVRIYHVSSVRRRP